MKSLLSLLACALALASSRAHASIGVTTGTAVLTTTQTFSGQNEFDSWSNFINSTAFGSGSSVSTFTPAGNLYLVSGGTITGNGPINFSTAPTTADFWIPKVTIGANGIGINNPAPASSVDIRHPSEDTDPLFFQLDHNNSGGGAPIFVAGEGSYNGGYLFTGSQNNYPYCFAQNNNNGACLFPNVSDIINMTVGYNITQTPSHILEVKQNSNTDPIADSWTTYPSDRRFKNLIRETKPEDKLLEKVAATPIYQYRRKKFSEFSVAKSTGTSRKEVAFPTKIPKYDAIRLGPSIEDPQVPQEILSFDKDGKPEGIDLLAYCGYLHAVIKEMSVRIKKLEEAKGKH